MQSPLIQNFLATVLISAVEVQEETAKDGKSRNLIDFGSNETGSRSIKIFKPI